MVAGQEVTPKDAKDTDRLKEYWTTGEGGHLIGWGEPNDWYRCVALVSRFMGPDAKGYCENLHQAATGMTTAEHTKLIKEGKNPGGKP